LLPGKSCNHEIPLWWELGKILFSPAKKPDLVDNGEKQQFIAQEESLQTQKNLSGQL
jgi:hypothetical protein